MKACVERPVATVMLFLAAAFLGVYSFMNIPLELAPSENYPRISIQTFWPDVPPEIIQTEITSLLEEVAVGVKGVRKVASTSSIGNSLITLEFDLKTNMEFAALALQEKIAGLRHELPVSATRPQIIPYVPEDFSTRPFLQYTISGDTTLQQLRTMLKEILEHKLGSVRGVKAVEVSGGSDPEIRIEMDHDRMTALRIQPFHMQAALNRWNQTFPAGKIRRGEQEYLFKIAGFLGDRKSLENMIVGRSGGVPILLRDVAAVFPTYGEIRSINRINGQPTLRLTVHKEKGVSTLGVSRQVKVRLDEVRRELPSDLVFRPVDDESAEILKSVRELGLLVLIIFAVLFVLVRIILKNIRPALLVLSSIVFSVLLTFNLVYGFGVSINMLTLGGLALGLGLFVDNSVVVFESILRLRERGLPPAEAAIQGPREVFIAVLASTLTTMSVFFTFPFFQGRLKIYYLPLAVVISSALAVSMLVSFTLIPALSPKLLAMRRDHRQGRLRETTGRLVAFLVRHPVAVILVVSALLYGSYSWFRKEVPLGEFFRWYSRDQLRVSLGMPPGTSIETTDEVIRTFEAKGLEKPYEKDINTQVSPERAYLVVTFPPEIEMSYRPYQLKEEFIQIATQFAGINIGVSGFDPQGFYSSIGGGTFYDSNIKFYGYNLKKLKDITGDLERRLTQNPRIREVRTVSSRYGWFRGTDSFENVLILDRQALQVHNIDPAGLFSHIQSLLRGRIQTPVRWRTEGRELAVSIKFPRAETMDIPALMDSLITGRNGEHVRLGMLASLEERPIAGSIDRENQQFQQTVMWEFRGPSKAASNYRKAVFESLTLPPGFTAVLDEPWRMTEEEKRQIGLAAIAALVLIFMILAALYESLLQPFYILLAVPLALCGVFVAFVISGFAFDSSAYIGVILLGGIVVNNSILLVDRINRNRREGLGLIEAVVQGSKDRVRPILMTAGTTILAMLPLILIQVEVGRRRIWSSLALATVGGLTSSTIFILAVIPIFYVLGERLRFRFRAGMAEIANQRRELL